MVEFDEHVLGTQWRFNANFMKVLIEVLCCIKWQGGSDKCRLFFYWKEC